MITHNLNLLDMYPGRVFECKDKALVEVSNDQLSEAEEDVNEQETI